MKVLKINLLLREKKMSIKNGNQMPNGTFKVITTDGMQEISTQELFSGKKVALFSVPGAFTPTCSNEHLPSYIKNYDQIIANGFDTIACMSVNDAFVMKAWGEERNVGDKILMLADGNADYTKSLGLELDGTGFGLGIRAKRFSIIVDDGTVVQLNIDESGYDLTSAEKTCGI
jgi:peroxiredoxin